MKLPRMRSLPWFAACVLAACAVLVHPDALAQSFPSRQIRIVVGFPPGGAVDANARTLAPKLAEILGQPVVVENRPGAAAQIAAEYVARQPADGHTLLLATVGHAITPALYRKLPYDTLGDFVAITQTTAASMLLLVSPRVTAQSLQAFIAAGVKQPGTLNYGSAGTNDPLGLAMEVLKFRANADIVAVQYKGVGPIYTALLASEIDAAFMPTSQSLGHISGGKLRALATGSPQRLSILPDVPTVAESGYPGYEATNWQGLFAPAKTPADTVRKIQAAVAQVLAAPEVRERMIAAGSEPIGSTPEAFDAKVRAEVARYAQVVEASRGSGPRLNATCATSSSAPIRSPTACTAACGRRSSMRSPRADMRSTCAICMPKGSIRCCPRTHAAGTSIPSATARVSNATSSGCSLPRRWCCASPCGASGRRRSSRAGWTG